MKTTLVNAGMEYHRPQIIPGTSLPNSTSTPSPAPMKSPIHLELTPCDSSSTTTSMKGQLDDTNLSPTDVFSGHHDYEMFLLQKEIDAPHDNLNHHVLHACEEQDQDVILTHATILSHTFALPQFMDQHNYEYQDPTDIPSTVPTAFQVSCDSSFVS